MRIIPNEDNNALLILTGTCARKSGLGGNAAKIDVVPLQVCNRIAVIAEVTLNDALQYGTKFHLPLACMP